MCSWEYNGHKDRLKTPLIRKEGKLVPASWDEAMGLIVEKSKEIIEKMTPHAIAFYVGHPLVSVVDEFVTYAVHTADFWTTVLGRIPCAGHGRKGWAGNFDHGREYKIVHGHRCYRHGELCFVSMPTVLLLTEAS